MGPEPTEQRWTIFRDVMAGRVGPWYVAVGPVTQEFREIVNVVPASVLEERDRELEVERRRSNGVASHAGHWAKRARESALEAERLRSQLDEWQERCRKLCDPEYGRWQETLLEAREALAAQREAA